MSISAISLHARRCLRAESGLIWPLLCALAICGLAPPSAGAQHVHGVIGLGVVVEEDTVAVSLKAPLSDVVGFEHAPENKEQRKLIHDAVGVLLDADAMFGLAHAANCTISDTSIEGPEFVTEHIAHFDSDSDNGDHGHHDEHAEDDGHHDEHEEHDSHGDESAREEHDHDHDEEHHDEHHHDHEHSDDHGESDDHDAGEHADVSANYQWACGNPAALDALALRFPESFTGVETIEVQILTSSGAQVMTADAQTASIPLAP